MTSNSKRLKLCSNNEDRISGLPDAILCRILSFCTTREAVQTSVLSHRWENVWASVPILDLDEQEYHYYRYVFRSQDVPQIRYDRDRFPQFVNRVLLFRCSGDIHRFRLVTNEMHNVSLINAWIATAIRRNVVELELTVGTPTYPHWEIPKRLFMCSSLVRLKLLLRQNISVMTPPSSNCFPSLKFLHVTVHFPVSDSMEKLFPPCFPVLEDLIIDGDLEDATSFNLDISAPKLKRLQIGVVVHRFSMVAADNHSEDYGCQIFVTADTPNLEELDIYYDFLVSYSLKSAKYLRTAKIGFVDVKDLKNRDYYLGLPDRICQLFKDIHNAKNLTVSALIFAALDIRYQSRLLTFSNLNHLELQLETCHCLQPLSTLLKISPNLEHLKISPKRKFFVNDINYCDDDNEGELEHGWDAPESVPVCLNSHLKSICLWDFKGCPDDMEVAKYLVKHGNVLKRVTVHTPLSEKKEMSQSSTALWSKFSKFPRGSKTCEIEFRIII